MLRRFIPLLLVLGCIGSAGAQTETAGALLVSLDARDPSAGTGTWTNAGALGPFRRIGAPVVRSVGGVRAVVFDGVKDAYRGPASVPEIEGRGARSIEVWVNNPTLDASEETLVAWGRRGGPAGADMALSWGRHPEYGAVTHWAADLGWNGTPQPGRWHHLVYTYDGKTARLYDNTAEKNAREITLRTARGQSINLAAQNGAEGGLLFVNEYDRSALAGSFALAEVRIHARALTAEQVRRNFAASAARFGAVALESAKGLIAGSGRRRLTTGAFTLEVSEGTQAALSLRPAVTRPAGADFDFLPSDRLEARAYDRFYQLGDLTFRTRVTGGAWQAYSSATRHARVRAVKGDGALAAADLSAAFPADCPLAVERRWVKQGKNLVLRFALRNRAGKPVEIGAFGAAMVFNNVLSGRSLDETHERCAFADPYIGGDAGYLQVTRLNGKGPALLVLPERGTAFEAYRPLRDDPTPRGVTFEGFYEWMVHTRAYVENEWKNARDRQWNAPTARTLRPGETVVYGFRFALAPGVRAIEPTLAALGRPVVVGVPGYVLPTDQPGRLFVRAPVGVAGMTVEPAGALRVGPVGKRTRNGWLDVALAGVRPGRCRLTIRYANGERQFIPYFVTPPAREQVRRLGAFHRTHQWFADPSDPFGRTFSFLNYHRDRRALVLQHPNTWMAGLSDEMGAGPNLLMAVKNLNQPDAAEVALLEKYVDRVLWGRLQNPDYGIRASLFYYDRKALPDFPYTVRGGWDRARTETTWRSYNYPHQAAIYWCLYRLARDHAGLVRAHPWQWYLRQAQRTALAMGAHAGPPPGGLQQFGQMVGSVYLEILRDCRREGWTREADELEAYERGRAEHFRSLKYPYGSEMPWDSTGQEEVYLLCRHFGFRDKAAVTRDAVLAYDPAVPSWGYNGTARRYFDEAVNGTEWPDIVRLLHHYGGPLNAIPLMTAFRDDPADFHLLRVGYAGTMGALANIDGSGFGSQCFDADPAILQFDPYVGDYGVAFYGHAANTGTYVVDHPEFGWLGFGGEVAKVGKTVRILPRDSFRNRLYIAPLRLFLTLDAGTFAAAVLDPARRTLALTLAPATAATPTARLRIEPSSGRRFVISPGRGLQRGGYSIPLGKRPVTIRLRESME